MRPIIDIDHISKRYGSGTVALNEVSLQIAEGEILALLGPNGAGKTTLISIICGLVVPSGGTVRVGLPAFTEAEKLLKNRIFE